jgi:hypothetical protein
MEDRAEKEAEAIVERFVADESSADLLRLQQSIAEALHTAYEKGRAVCRASLVSSKG